MNSNKSKISCKRGFTKAVMLNSFQHLHLTQPSFKAEEILNQVHDDNKQRGFTLIELLVVVLIIGILAAVALPQYQKAVEKSRATEVMTLLSALYQAEKVYYLEDNTWTTDFSKLDIDFPCDSGTEETISFLCGDWDWRKCSDGSCAYAVKSWKDGFWGLGMYFRDTKYLSAGGIYCLSDNDEKGREMCKVFGFTDDYYANSAWLTGWGRAKQYKK